MAKIKVWQPLAIDDLPVGLASSLRVANRESKRNWAVCRQVVVDDTGVSQAEILRLREKVHDMERVIERLKKGGTMPVTDVYTQVKDTIMQGKTISCAKGRWSEYRAALHKLAAWATDNKQGVYANIALNEVRRLDRVFEYQKEEKP